VYHSSILFYAHLFHAKQSTIYFSILLHDVKTSGINSLQISYLTSYTRLFDVRTP
jgi:hypothetical protein